MEGRGYIYWQLNYSLTDLYHNDQEKGHVPCEVNFMDLKHRGTETKYQSPNYDLDGLKGTEQQMNWNVSILDST